MVLSKIYDNQIFKHVQMNPILKNIVLELIATEVTMESKIIGEKVRMHGWIESMFRISKLTFTF